MDVFSLPLPGEAGFEHLTQEEQAWVSRMVPWLRRAVVRSPAVALMDSGAQLLRLEDCHYFVHFYRLAPFVFDPALAHLLGSTVRAKTPSQRQKAWKAKLERVNRRRTNASKLLPGGLVDKANSVPRPMSLGAVVAPDLEHPTPGKPRR